MKLKDILKALKVNHYIKNFVVLIPLIFSMNVFNIDKTIACMSIFVSFCFISSAVYILNDLIDIKQDQRHPIKCNRPIASGKISKNLAIFLLCTLIVLSLCFSFTYNILCTLTILAYFVLNVFYSFGLKNVALIDVACIAIGFIIRILAGCYAIEVTPSSLVILMTFFLSMFFTFSKRKMEMQLIDTSNYRNTLKVFNIDIINQFVLVNAMLAISFYFTYVQDKTTIERAGSNYLYLTTIPFTLIIFQLLLLTNNQKDKDDPIIFFESNKLLQSLIILYFVILFVVLLWLK